MVASIRLDARESALLAELPEAVASGMGTGDIAVGDRVLAERKRVDDLAASIRDGRWRDQLARMTAVASKNPRVRTAIIVEGSWPAPSQTINGLPGPTLESALAGAFVRDGVSVFRTESVSDTARLVRAWAERAGRDEPPSVQGGASAAGLHTPPRKDALASTRVIAKAQMRMIPGVSETAAEAILGDCQTMGEWLAVWSGRQADLADVRVRSRRLGGALAARIMTACGGAGRHHVKRECPGREAQHE